MSSDSELLIGLWDHFRDLISPKLRVDSALVMIKLFEEHGLEISLHELEGEDNYLDEAVSVLKDDDEDAEDEEEY
jgi:hypothetical protein